jgi:hypothetical protein
MSRRSLIALTLMTLPALAQNKPLSLHPENPHYFLFRNKPTILITSGEHYGAVLNTTFDYKPYFAELARHGLNQTRTFSGTYREIPESFGITDNTLSPKDEHYKGPWARSGANKFDLEKFDDAYFARLKDFITEAGRHGVVVEYVLFCTLYNDKLWDVSPMNPKNVINDLGGQPINRREVHTLKHKKLLAYQEAFVKKVVTELNGFDNLYYEICNEPYFEGVAEDWQAHVAKTVADAEAGLPNKHLIAQNIANDKKKVEKVTPHVSILNFHYATPPDTVEMNYRHNLPIGDDETGFKGKEDVHYRTEAWDFIIAGGGTYSNLDYSFTPGHPAGTLKEFKSPGGGGEELRKQLSILKKFIHGFEFVKMKPANDVITGGLAMVPLDRKRSGTDSARIGSMTVRCLAEPGKQYALYVRGGAGGSGGSIHLNLPDGEFRGEWVSTKTGEVVHRERLKGSRQTVLIIPAYDEDIALRITLDTGDLG